MAFIIALLLLLVGPFVVMASVRFRSSDRVNINEYVFLSGSLALLGGIISLVTAGIVAGAIIFIYEYGRSFAQCGPYHIGKCEYIVPILLMAGCVTLGISAIYGFLAAKDRQIVLLWVIPETLFIVLVLTLMLLYIVGA